MKPRTNRPEWIQDVFESLAPMVTVEECAEVLRMSPETVRRHCRLGELHAVQRTTGRGGSPLLIPRAAIADWLQRHEYRPAHTITKGKP